jgi:hypothetical protein
VNRDLAILLMLVVAVLSFLLGYSLSPCQTAQLQSPAAAGAPGYGAAAPGYGEESAKPKSAAPGYND